MNFAQKIYKKEFIFTNTVLKAVTIFWARFLKWAQKTGLNIQKIKKELSSAIPGFNIVWRAYSG